ncbi:iron ABC transporter permease [Roseovarius aestuarii]|nr:iron ABC transporter permease [Roseovarius aestuarii]
MTRALLGARHFLVPRHHPRALIVLMTLVGAMLVVISAGVGSLHMSAGRIFGHLLSYLGMGTSPLSDLEASVLMSIRLPRVLGAAAAGAVLAMTGVLMQTFFRNPLAEPAIVGVASGGALGAVTWIVTGHLLGPLMFVPTQFALPVMAFAGSAVVCVAILAVSRDRDGQVDATTMLLAGIAVNAVTGAGIGLLIFVADDAQLRDLTFWGMGSLANISWAQLAVLIPVFLVTVLFGLRFSPILNALLLGDSAAHDLGINVRLVKLSVIALTCLACACVVAMCGVIGFVGLIAPHGARKLVGPDHKVLIPLSLVLGAILLGLADLIARTIVSPSELPIGILTALAGGPIFLWLLKQRRTER